MTALRSIIICISIFMSYTLNSQQIYLSEHDATIDKLVTKAKKNKLNEKRLDLLAKSYHQANEEDFKRIMELKSSGQPDIWIEIYFRTNNMEIRQNKIKNLSDNIKKSMNFKELNLDEEISVSKERAELYICARTNLLFKKNVEENLREAEMLINYLSIINPHSNNIDDLRLKFFILPSKHILLRIATPIDLQLPEDFAHIALDFEETTIHNIPFDIIPNEDTDYDLMIRILVDEKIISPEKVESVSFEEKKDNFKAIVTDKTMTKSATLKGKIQIIDVENYEILISTPYDITSTFRHHYAEMKGEKDACSEQTLKLLNSQIIDFPNDKSLLEAVAKDLNSILKNHYQKKIKKN